MTLPLGSTLMFKRLARKRKRREEEDALGLTEEMKEALGMGRIESDSDESSSEEDSNSEHEGKEQGGEEGSEDEDEDEEESEAESEAEEVDDDKVEKQSEIAPTGISKRTMKKVSIYIYRSSVCAYDNPSHREPVS